MDIRSLSVGVREWSPSWLHRADRRGREGGGFHLKLITFDCGEGERWYALTWRSHLTAQRQSRHSKDKKMIKTWDLCMSRILPGRDLLSLDVLKDKGGSSSEGKEMTFHMKPVLLRSRPQSHWLCLSCFGARRMSSISNKRSEKMRSRSFKMKSAAAKGHDLSHDVCHCFIFPPMPPFAPSEESRLPEESDEAWNLY